MRKFNIVIVALVLIINTLSAHSQPLIVSEPFYTYNSIGENPSETEISISDSIYFNDNNYEIIRPIAFKTNLLFDIATIINIEIEVPLSQKMSLAGEWMFPWWLSNNHQRSLQLMGGNLELKYWLAQNSSKQNRHKYSHNHNPLTGWFVGVYGGGGLYDLEWNRKGYQGEYAIVSGLSVGYALPLSNNFNMEFSLGAGYFKTNYRHYNAQQDSGGKWHLIKSHEGKFSWWGPNKAKISLSWYPHLKKRGGRK